MSTNEQANDPNRILTEAFQANGVVYKIAEAAYEPGHAGDDLNSPDNVGNVILPSGNWGPRGQMLAEAKPAMIRAANEHEAEVYLLAATLDMRHEEPISQAELDRIDGDNATWVAEGGANKQYFVRPGLLTDAMQRKYGADIAATKVKYQVGIGRPVNPKLPDDRGNPEYTTVRKLLGTDFPEGPLDEYGISVAMALHDGYTELPGYGKQYEAYAEQVSRFHKDGVPDLVIIKPRMTEKTGLESGLWAIAHIAGMPRGSQFVVGTSGQYRAKSGHQVARFEQKYGLQDKMQPAVMLGDEPGYRVTFAGAEHATPDRAAMPYVHEAVVLQRMLAEPNPYQTSTY